MTTDAPVSCKIVTGTRESEPGAEIVSSETKGEYTLAMLEAHVLPLKTFHVSELQFADYGLELNLDGQIPTVEHHMSSSPTALACVTDRITLAPSVAVISNSTIPHVIWLITLAPSC